MVRATFSRAEWETLAAQLPHHGEHIRHGIAVATGGRSVGPRALISVRLPNQRTGEILTRAGRLGFCTNVRSL